MSELIVRPFLMFQGKASEALTFYLSIFPDAQMLSLENYSAGEAGIEGSIKRAIFLIGGQEVYCTDSVVKHTFSFTPAFSFFVFFVECQSERQFRQIASTLREGGTEFMPIGAYGFSRLFAWVNDRFGVSWQLNWA